jgi:hypothetical protein
MNKSICVTQENRTKYWYLNDKLHREDGPAVEWDNGYKSWYLNNKRLNPEETIKDFELANKHPELIEAMIIYLVHES